MTAVGAAVEWPADNVQRVPVARLLPYARNAKKHSRAQVGQIAAMISELGWTTPVLVDEQGVLIAGHGRVLAAKLLNLSEIPTMVAKGWTEAQVKAYRLADNALNQAGGGWDEGMLKIELQEVTALNFDIGKIGLDMEFMTKLFDEPAEPAERESRGLGEPIIQFNIVFDDDAQQDAWFSFVRILKAMYPNEETLGARLALYIAANASE